jgi:hypothetical protein
MESPCTETRMSTIESLKIFISRNNKEQFLLICPPEIASLIKLRQLASANLAITSFIGY